VPTTLEGYGDEDRARIGAFANRLSSPEALSLLDTINGFRAQLGVPGLRVVAEAQLPEIAPPRRGDARRPWWRRLSLPVRLPSRRRARKLDVYPLDGAEALLRVLEQHPKFHNTASIDSVIPILNGAGGARTSAQRAGDVVRVLVAGVQAVAAVPGDPSPYLRTLMRVGFSADAESTLLRNYLTGLPLGFPDVGPPLDLKLPAWGGCIAELQTAIALWQQAFKASLVRGVSDAITSIVPKDACPGDTVTIIGSGFGDPPPPPETRVLFRDGRVEAKITGWSKKQIQVTLPPGVSRGCVGLYDFTVLQLAQGLSQASQAAAATFKNCMGAEPAQIFADALGGDASAVAARIVPAPCLPGGENFFDGGLPEIIHFSADQWDSRQIRIGPGGTISLRWKTRGADRVEIVPVPIAGDHELPDIPGPLPDDGTYALPEPLPGATHWEAAYELRAHNRCTDATGLLVTDRIVFAMARRVALALSGGGARGDFEVGACRFLYDHGVKPETIVGSSVGAINGIKLAEGDQAIDRLEEIWRTRLTFNWDMYLEQPWLAGIKDSKVKEFFRDGVIGAASNVAGAVARWLLFPGFALLDLAAAGIDIAAFTKALEQAMEARSIYNLTPIRQKLGDSKFLDLDKVQKSGIQLWLAAVGLESGELKFILPSGAPGAAPSEAMLVHIRADGNLLFGGPVNLIDGVMASAAIPAIFPPVKVGGENCVDGGVREIVPVRAAVRAGAHDIYAVSASARVPPSPTSFDAQTLPGIGMRSIAEVMTDEIIVNDQERLIDWNPAVSVIKIRPTHDVHDPFTINPGLIDISIDYGFMRAADTIVVPPDKRPAAEDFSDKITLLRKRIWGLEQWANGETDVTTPGSQLQGVEDPDGLREVRKEKRNLKVLTEERRALAPLPQNTEQWWKQWERHNWQPIIPTPWHAMGSRIPGVPDANAEAPP
jgi:NTE family protein